MQTLDRDNLESIGKIFAKALATLTSVKFENLDFGK